MEIHRKGAFGMSGRLISLRSARKLSQIVCWNVHGYRDSRLMAEVVTKGHKIFGVYTNELKRFCLVS